MVRRRNLIVKWFPKERRSWRRLREDWGGVRGGRQRLESWDEEDGLEVVEEGRVDRPKGER